ncbi:MAG TPA: DUF3142 domain-containing protein [Myxococcales bacterium]
MTPPRLPGATLLLALLAPLLACRPEAAPARAALGHEAYVWQRLWTPGVSAAVREAPRELAALHVLARERSGPERSPVDVAVDLEALVAAGREVVAVLRIDGTSALDEVGLGELAEIARRWAAAGVRVRGLEVDHDCATEKLAAYAAWLEREKARVPDFRVGLTALPAWSSSPHVARLAALADEVVLQVHAVQAPTLFEPRAARGYAEAWSAATGRPFRLALPTYRVRLRDGTLLESDPAQVASLLASLSERPVPHLAGVAWFRLGHPGDAASWSAPTLAAVLRGEPLVPRLETRLVESVPGAVDLQVANVGTVDARGPQTIALAGSVDFVEGVRGCRGRGPSLVCPAPDLVRAGESVVVGFARGKELRLADPH